ncbi:MAG: hypothetical protein MZV64_21620 [Ignavibacteriales bacterium]|nr:hypothetical protein [Ignavibacteriales bacterium]
MPGTFRWIMIGTTLIDAPIIEQMPVAARPRRPRSRARWGESTRWAVGRRVRTREPTPNGGSTQAARSWGPDGESPSTSDQPQVLRRERIT